MARRHLLTDRQVRGAAPGKHNDGDGLVLIVAPDGSRRFRLRTKHPQTGKETMRAVGEAYPTTTLADARRLADELRASLRNAVDNPTMRDLAAKVMADREAHGDAPVTLRKYESRQRRILAAMGDMAAREVTPADLQRLIDGMEAREQRWRVALDVRTIIKRGNLPTGQFDNVLSQARRGMVKKPASRAAQTDLDSIRAAWRAIHANTTLMPATRAILLVGLLVPARPGELRRWRWADLQGSVMRWHQTKTDESRRVVLPWQALEIILQDMAPVTGEFELIFSHTVTGAPLSMNAQANGLRSCGLAAADWSAHGFRAAWRTLAADQDVAFHVAEMVLGHTQRGVVKAYQRSELDRQVGEALQRLADLIAG